MKFLYVKAFKKLESKQNRQTQTHRQRQITGGSRDRVRGPHGERGGRFYEINGDLETEP